MVKCSILGVVDFIFLSIVYGSAFAAINEGLKYFSAGFIQIFRMLFGFCFCLLVLIIRLIFFPKYRSIVLAHFNGWGILHIIIGGLLNLGIPHCLITVGQEWIPVYGVQVVQPIATSIGAIFGHFVLPDEPFTLQKLFSLILALCGVVCTSVPSFMTSKSDSPPSKIGFGFFLVIISMCMFGIAPVYFKWKAPNADVTVSATVQTFASTIWDVIWSLGFDGPKKMHQMTKDAPAIAWMWPALTGVLSTGLAVHGFLILLKEIGAFGSNFIPFGQLIVGMIISVAILKEWKDYSWWEILLCSIGLLFICGSLFVGFYEKKGIKKNSDSSSDSKSANANEDDFESSENGRLGNIGTSSSSSDDDSKEGLNCPEL
ncbi:Integral membrane protein [Tritrichomonas foetus]|uniref:Integral membrane protein n=1 Tax=Tritrichomonas foetus TaxID=1144522 RepID=A0A1J4JSR0_9EUKA|nr:Integral membrane protein [Tritrichomonas foetus]|eukprot:OHT02099.1 Integral membrane protein [Tritrichomonas foetus]